MRQPRPRHSRRTARQKFRRERMTEPESPVEQALRAFWGTRDAQLERQIASGRRDAGTRGAVTGGGHLDPIRDMIVIAAATPGVMASTDGTGTRLPGRYRPTKKWDLVFRKDGDPVAAIELKSMVGSFGNNMNNRTEEALVNAVDLQAAHRTGLLPRMPWTGYVFVIQDAHTSTRSSTLSGVHIDEAFHGASYIDRLAILCERLVDDGLYNATWTVASTGLPDFAWWEPRPAVSGFERFVSSLRQHLQEA